MEDKELKKKLAKIPDVDKNGDPIYKIADAEKESSKEKPKENAGADE
jgi:predicted small lipoprotein YifL